MYELSDKETTYILLDKALNGYARFDVFTYLTTRVRLKRKHFTQYINNKYIYLNSLIRNKTIFSKTYVDIF